MSDTRDLYSTNILRIENFAEKLELDYERDERESLSINEEDVILDVFQLAQKPGKFELFLKTESMELHLLNVDYNSLMKLKKGIENIKK